MAIYSNFELIDSGLLNETTLPTPAADKLSIGAIDDGGVTKLAVKDSTGTQVTLEAGSIADNSITDAKLISSGIKSFITFQTLTDAASIIWDSQLGHLAKVTLTDNRTLSNISNLVAGSYSLIVIQDGVGSHTLALDTSYKTGGGLGITLSTGANKQDIVTFISDGTTIYAVEKTDFLT